MSLTTSQNATAPKHRRRKGSSARCLTTSQNATAPKPPPRLWSSGTCLTTSQNATAPKPAKGLDELVEFIKKNHKD